MWNIVLNRTPRECGAGARLAGYLFHRVLQTGKDSRLDFLFPQDDKEPLLTGPSKCGADHLVLTSCWCRASWDARAWGCDAALQLLTTAVHVPCG